MASGGGLTSARGSLLFLIGLGASMFAALQLEHWDPRRSAATTTTAAPVGAKAEPAVPLVALRSRSGLNADDLADARLAWSYFTANTIAGTGLTGSVEGYDGTTLWDLGSQLYAIISAEIVGIVPPPDAQARVAAMLTSLNRLPHASGQAPNKAYDARTLQQVDYNNAPSAEGIGWSGTDIARLASAVRLAGLRYPSVAAQARDVLRRLDLGAVVDAGHIRGGERAGGASHAESRLGYEQYAARAMAALGFIDVAAIDNAGADAAVVVSEPFILTGLEFGWDTEQRQLASSVFHAQEMRFTQTGKLTASSEDHLDRDPRFVYTTVPLHGESWTAVTGEGKEVPDSRTISTKAAFGWDALVDSGYAKQLLGEARRWTGTHGFDAGQYERTGERNAVLSTNTNAVILESLAYRVAGPLARAW